MDKYKNFKDLSKNEKAKHFYIYQQEGSSGLTVVAPHVGGIEPGTSEIAKGIAGTEHTLYCFEGRKPKGNRDLHITSTNFTRWKGRERTSPTYEKFVSVIREAIAEIIE